MSDEDVASMARHSSSRITRDMYVRKTASTLERARNATATMPFRASDPIRQVSQASGVRAFPGAMR